MKNIKRNIRERIIRVMFDVAFCAENRLDNMRANLVSNYDRNNFFVKVVTRIVFALEWVAVKARVRLNIIEFNEMFKDCDYMEDYKYLEEMCSLEDDEI